MEIAAVRRFCDSSPPAMAAQWDACKNMKNRERKRKPGRSIRIQFSHFVQYSSLDGVTSASG
jgi:hypothetical protein